MSQMPVISKSAEALTALNDNYWDLEYYGVQTNFTLITHNAIVSKLVFPLRKTPIPTSVPSLIGRGMGEMHHFQFMHVAEILR